MADVEIRSVYLGMTGGHLRGFNNRGYIHRVRRSRDFRVGCAGRDQECKDDQPAGAEPRDSCHPATFSGDGQDGITNPVGMLGSRIEVDVHVVHGP